MDKRKLAGALSLGALAAGAGSTASAWDPLSWGAKKVKSASDKISSWKVGKKLKITSNKIREFFTTSKDHELENSHDKSLKNEKGYGAAINIAYRIYDILGKEDKKLLINKLKDLCINYQNEDKIISEFKDIIANAKKTKDKIINELRVNINDTEIKNKNGINKKEKEDLEKNLTFLREELTSHKTALSSYSNLLLKMAKDTGIEDGEIDKCFTENIDGYQRSKSESNVKNSIKMRNNTVIDDGTHEVYDFYIYKFNEGLSFSKEIKGKILKQICYSSNNEFHNEEAVSKAIENLEKKVFNLDDDKDGEKALKLIVSLIINKYEAENKKGITGRHKDILKNLLGLKINGKNVKETKFRNSEYASSFSEKELDNKKIDLLNELAKNNSVDLKNILTAATDKANADNVFSAKTKGLFTKIADSKITRLSVTGAGAYFGGMVLAPALGLGLVGTTLLATGAASAANAVTDYVSDKNARSNKAWSVSGIGARYKSLSTRIPMTLTAYSAKTIFGTVKSLTSVLLK